MLMLLAFFKDILSLKRIQNSFVRLFQNIVLFWFILLEKRFSVIRGDKFAERNRMAMTWLIMLCSEQMCKFYTEHVWFRSIELSLIWQISSRCLILLWLVTTQLMAWLSEWEACIQHNWLSKQLLLLTLTLTLYSLRLTHSLESQQKPGQATVCIYFQNSSSESYLGSV